MKDILYKTQTKAAALGIMFICIFMGTYRFVKMFFAHFLNFFHQIKL